MSLEMGVGFGYRGRSGGGFYLLFWSPAVGFAVNKPGRGTLLAVQDRFRALFQFCHFFQGHFALFRIACPCGVIIQVFWEMTDSLAVKAQGTRLEDSYRVSVCDLEAFLDNEEGVAN